MVEPIEANYVPDGDEWAVTVTGRGQTVTARAPGLIAARDQADQMVEKLAPDEKHHTVVHLLKGSAIDFTTAYLHARLNMPEWTNRDDSSATPTDTSSGNSPDATSGPDKQADAPTESKVESDSTAG